MPAVDDLPKTMHGCRVVRRWVSLVRMYATNATLRPGVSHVRAMLPTLLDFVSRTGFPAEQVTPLTADWEDVPSAFAARTTNLVLRRDPLSADAWTGECARSS